jgi:hypothetical protein
VRPGDGSTRSPDAGSRRSAGGSPPTRIRNGPAGASPSAQAVRGPPTLKKPSRSSPNFTGTGSSVRAALRPRCRRRAGPGAVVRLAAGEAIVTTRTTAIATLHRTPAKNDFAKSPGFPLQTARLRTINHGGLLTAPGCTSPRIAMYSCVCGRNLSSHHKTTGWVTVGRSSFPHSTFTKKHELD